jgi:hypothetical protein
MIGGNRKALIELAREGYLANGSATPMRGKSLTCQQPTLLILRVCDPP